MALCTLAAVAALAAHARWVRRPKSGVQNARESVAHLADLLVPGGGGAHLQPAGYPRACLKIGDVSSSEGF